MEVIKRFNVLVLVVALVSCTNTDEFETGEIRTFHLLKNAWTQWTQETNQKSFPDSRQLINRKKIDAYNIPVLFIELKSGQNGTLTLYPGQGDGETWLGADGATITFYQGVLKASRGMGDDIMGSASSMPSWSEIKRSATYERNISYLAGNNLIQTTNFSCHIVRADREELINVWEVNFKVNKYEETCTEPLSQIKNMYYLDKNWIVRRSLQFHSKTVGYILTERVDR